MTFFFGSTGVGSGVLESQDTIRAIAIRIAMHMNNKLRFMVYSFFVIWQNTNIDCLKSNTSNYSGVFLNLLNNL